MTRLNTRPNTTEYSRYFEEPILRESYDDGNIYCFDGCCAFCKHAHDGYCGNLIDGEPHCRGDEQAERLAEEKYLADIEKAMDEQDALQIAIYEFVKDDRYGLSHDVSYYCSLIFDIITGNEEPSCQQEFDARCDYINNDRAVESIIVDLVRYYSIQEMEDEYDDDFVELDDRLYDTRVSYTPSPAEITREYNEWVHDPENEFNCVDCPDGNGDYRGCGLQKCWVTVHIFDVEDASRYGDCPF